MNTTRRGFIAGASALAATTAGAQTKAETGAQEEKKEPGRLIVSPPVLQNAAETSMGVGFAV
jgi:hypothetical protein